MINNIHWTFSAFVYLNGRRGSSRVHNLCACSNFLGVLKSNFMAQLFGNWTLKSVKFTTSEKMLEMSRKGRELLTFTSVNWSFNKNSFLLYE